MMDDDAVGALLWLQKEALSEPNADIFLGLEQAEDFLLILKIGAGRVSKRVARSAILLVKEIVDARRVFAGDSQ